MGRPLKLATRFDIDGVRHYRTGDRPDCAYPSVTSILSKTASAASAEKLRLWNERNPGARDAAALRGSAVHKAAEDYLRGRSIELDDTIQPFWDGMPAHLDSFDYVVWSEKPLLPEWSFCIGDDDISRVWSHEHRYCGCPDIVGVRKGVAILADIKSSNGPYCRYHPTQVDPGEVEDGLHPRLFGGWMKFSKTALQLGAYAIALEETLGFRIDAAQMLITTPTGTQSFLLRGHELHTARYKWLQKVRAYYDLIAIEAKTASEMARKVPDASDAAPTMEPLMLAAA